MRMDKLWRPLLPLHSGIHHHLLRGYSHRCDLQDSATMPESWQRLRIRRAHTFTTSSLYAASRAILDPNRSGEKFFDRGITWVAYFCGGSAVLINAR